MNERIRELAVQAGYGTRWNTTEQFEQFMSEFSNSIIRECSTIIQNLVDHRVPASEYPKKLIETFEKENNE